MQQPEIWELNLGSDTSFKKYSKDVNISELFTKIYQQKLNKAGKKITADDINNLIKTISENIYYYQHGGTFEFKQGLTYPKDSIVRYGNVYYISLQETSVTPSVDETWKAVFDIDESTSDLSQRLDSEINRLNNELLDKISDVRDELISDDNRLRADLGNLSNKVDEIERVEVDLLSDFSDILNRFDADETALNTIKTDINQNKNDIIELKSSVNSHENKITLLESKAETTNQRLTTNATAINNLNALTGSNVNRITDLENGFAETNTSVVNHYQEFLDYKFNNDTSVADLESLVDNNYETLDQKIDSVEADIKSTTYTKDEIDQKVVTLYKLKGSVPTFNDLPNDPQNGDVYDVIEDGMNYAWFASENKWDSLGTIVDVPQITSDISALQAKDLSQDNDISNINTELDALTNTVNENKTLAETNLQNEKAEILTELRNADSTLSDRISANSDHIDAVNTSLQQMISDLRDELISKMNTKVADLDTRIHEDITTSINTVNNHIDEIEQELLSIVTHARESKTVTVQANSSVDVQFDNIDHLGMDVRVLVLDNDENSVTYNKYINSEGCCTIAFDHDKYTIYNETDEDLQFIIFLGIFVTVPNSDGESE